MKKALGLLLAICVLMLSMSFAIVSAEAVIIDPVQTLLVEVLSWDNTTNVRTDFNDTVLKPLVALGIADAVPTTIVDEAKTRWGAKAKDSVKDLLITDTNAMLTALTSFKNADSDSKKIFTTAEMVNGYPDITSAGRAATGFDLLKATINQAMTGDAANDNGIKFVTLFLRELVRTNYMVLNDAGKSTVSTYNGNRIDFYLDSSIDTANKTFIVTRVNNLLNMIPNFTTNVLLPTYAVDSTVKVGTISDTDNHLGRFMSYTEEQVNKNAGEIANFYNFLVAQSPTTGSTLLPIIKSISGGGSSGGGGGVRFTPKPTATPTPTPTATPTPDVSPTPTPTPEGPTAPPDFAKFEDLGEFDWAETAINYLAYKGIIKGITESKYEPNEGIKRGDLAILMVRTFGLTSDATGTFEDVPEDSYYYEQCRIGKDNGILLGVDENNQYYEPERIITREEMMALIVRSLVKMGYIEAPTDTDLSMYNDQESVEAYARPYVAFLSNNGIVIGDQNGNVRPKDTINRAEAAAIIYRLYKLNIEGLLK